jgi:RNA polymerase primary sigma factor
MFAERSAGGSSTSTCSSSRGRSTPLPADSSSSSSFLCVGAIIAMLIREFHAGEASWRGLMSRPEAKVMTTTEERKLLVELVDCRDRILDAFPLPAETKWAQPARDSELQQRVRMLAGSDATLDPAVVRLRPVARRYEEIRTKLAMANVRLVAHVAKRYQDRGIPHADLIQEGFCALLLAVDRFDLINETRLATYAIWWIRQAIQRAVAAGAYPVRLNPRQLQYLARAQDQRPKNDWTRRVQAGGLSSNPAHTLKRLLAATRPAVSLDAPSRSDGTNALAEYLVAASDDEPPTDNTRDYLGSMLKILDPREQVVLKLRFGLSGEPRQTLVQVSRVLGVSKERVRQLQDRALKKIRCSSIGAQLQEQFDSSTSPPRLCGSRGVGG